MFNEVLRERHGRRCIVRREEADDHEGRVETLNNVSVRSVAEIRISGHPGLDKSRVGHSGSQGRITRSIAKPDVFPPSILLDEPIAKAMKIGEERPRSAVCASLSVRLP